MTASYSAALRYTRPGDREDAATSVTVRPPWVVAGARGHAGLFGRGRVGGVDLARDDEQRPALDLLEDASHVEADHADADDDQAREQHEEDDQARVAGRLARDEVVDDVVDRQRPADGRHEEAE